MTDTSHNIEMSKIAEGQRQHREKLDQEEAHEAFKSTIAAAAASLRVLATVHAGGLISLLGFVGTLSGKTIQVDLSALKLPASAFALGLFLAVSATVGMFAAQLYVYRSVITNGYADKQSKRYERRADRFRMFNLIAGFASLCLVAIGLAFCWPVVAALKGL